MTKSLIASIVAILVIALAVGYFGLRGSIGKASINRERWTSIKLDDIVELQVPRGLVRAERNTLSETSKSLLPTLGERSLGDGPFDRKNRNANAVTFALEVKGSRNFFSGSYRSPLLITVSLLESAERVMIASDYCEAHARLSDDNELSSMFDQTGMKWSPGNGPTLFWQGHYAGSTKRGAILQVRDKKMQVMILWKEGTFDGTRAETVLTRIVADAEWKTDLNGHFRAARQSVVDQSKQDEVSVRALLAATGVNANPARSASVRTPL